MSLQHAGTVLPVRSLCPYHSACHQRPGIDTCFNCKQRDSDALCYHDTCPLCVTSREASCTFQADVMQCDVFISLSVGVHCVVSSYHWHVTMWYLLCGWCRRDCVCRQLDAQHTAPTQCTIGDFPRSASSLFTMSDRVSPCGLRLLRVVLPPWTPPCLLLRAAGAAKPCF